MTGVQTAPAQQTRTAAVPEQPPRRATAARPRVRRPGRASVDRRLIARLVIGGVLLAGCAAGAVLEPEPAQAKYTESQSGAAQLATTTLQWPVFDAPCQNNGGNITISWHFSSSNVPGLTASNVQWSANSGLVNTLTNILTPGGLTGTGPNAAGEYTTTITSGLVSSLLSLALPYYIQAQTSYGGWTAVSPNSAKGISTGLIGIGLFSCTVS